MSWHTSVLHFSFQVSSNDDWLSSMFLWSWSVLQLKSHDISVVFINRDFHCLICRLCFSDRTEGLHFTWSQSDHEDCLIHFLSVHLSLELVWFSSELISLYPSTASLHPHMSVISWPCSLKLCSLYWWTVISQKHSSCWWTASSLKSVLAAVLSVESLTSVCNQLIERVCLLS